MKDTMQQAKSILETYVQNLKNESAVEDGREVVTTYCYDNFAQGIRAVMPDVDEETIDEMYSASGFTTGKYRKGLANRWFESSATLDDIERVIAVILANTKTDIPLSLADAVEDAGIKLCRKTSDYYAKGYHIHEGRLTCQRAIDALIDAGLCTKTAVKTCGHVHIYLYTFN